MDSFLDLFNRVMSGDLASVVTAVVVVSIAINNFFAGSQYGAVLSKVFRVIQIAAGVITEKAKQ